MVLGCLVSSKKRTLACLSPSNANRVFADVTREGDILDWVGPHPRLCLYMKDIWTQKSREENIMEKYRDTENTAW